MLWLVAALVFVVVTWTVRRYLKQDRLIPTGFMNALEAVVEFVRDAIVLPNVGKKWVNTWTPLILTLFVFILCANAIGLIPDLRSGRPRSIASCCTRRSRVVHQAASCTAARRHGNFNVTAALATITFGAIIVAGTKAHGFVKHWMNIVPHGLAWRSTSC